MKYLAGSADMQDKRNGGHQDSGSGGLASNSSEESSGARRANTRLNKGQGKSEWQIHNRILLLWIKSSRSVSGEWFLLKLASCPIVDYSSVSRAFLFNITGSIISLRVVIQTTLPSDISYANGDIPPCSFWPTIISVPIISAHRPRKRLSPTRRKGVSVSRPWNQRWWEWYTVKLKLSSYPTISSWGFGPKSSVTYCSWISGR